MKQILLTGGAGFIGFHLAQHLISDPLNSLLLVDNLQRGQMDEEFQSFLAANPDRVSFVKADLTDPASFAQLPQTIHQVYHLAAVNGTKYFYSIPQEVLRINTLSLIHLLEWSIRLPAPPKILFTSSNEAYAGALESFHQLPIPTPETVPLVISDPYNPRWTYAATKLIGELLLIHYAGAHHFPAVIVRPHNFYGPRAGYDHVIPELCQRIQKREDPFAVYGMDETRTFCFITDAVRAMQQLMDSSTTDGHPIETVHIGDTQEIRIADLAEKMFSISGWRPSSLENKPSPVGSVKRRLADISKIQQLIGWKPEVTLDEGLRRSFEWYQRHPKPIPRV